MQTVKVQSRVHRCAVLTGPSLLAHARYRLRKSLRYRARDLVLGMAEFAFFELSKLNNNLSTLFT